MKKLPDSTVDSLIIILFSILGVFIFFRLTNYLLLVEQVIPRFFYADINGFRLHHFVYGNILITITSFAAIGLGIQKHKRLFALFYGIGLGMVLDEFLLWIGDIEQLQSEVWWIPHSLTAVATVTFVIASIIMIRLYKLHKLAKQLK
jgi:hypothetical protein